MLLLFPTSVQNPSFQQKVLFGTRAVQPAPPGDSYSPLRPGPTVPWVFDPILWGEHCESVQIKLGLTSCPIFPAGYSEIEM